jgi:hypothetical protein
MPKSRFFDFQANDFGGVDLQRDGLSLDDLRRASSAFGVELPNIS